MKPWKTGIALSVLAAFALGMAIGSYVTANKYVGLVWRDGAMQTQRAQLAAIIEMACETPEFMASDYRGTCRFTREEIMRGYLPMPILLPVKTP